MKDISRHLSEDGILYIKEQPVDFNDENNFCSRQMPSEEIKASIKANHFIISEEYYLKDWIIYKCIKSN